MLIGIVFFSLRPLSAQSGTSVFAWEDANLALLLPQDWTASSVVLEEQPALELHNGSGLISVLLLPDTTTDAEMRAALETRLRTLNVFSYALTATTWLGRDALMVQTNSQSTSFGRAGRLPDRRVLVMAAHNTPAPVWNTVINSIVFSADSTPASPSYALLWRASLPQTSVFDVDVQPQITALAYSPLNQLYATVTTQGVLAFDPTNGAYLASFPFTNASDPSSLVVDASGAAYVGDIACRCLQVLRNRAWAAPQGSFGGSAPFDLDIAPDGTIYAVDRSASGYTLQSLKDGRALTIPLSFNGAAAPLVAADSEGNVTVIEWLSSLIDGNVNGAVATLENNAVSLEYWLHLSPDAVADVAVSPSGEMVLALTDGHIVRAQADGSVTEIVREEATPRALTFAPDGTLFVARADNTIVARSMSIAPEHTGDGTLRNDVPVQGILSENVARQEWRYEGSAGEQITISAVDLRRNDGLDMAIRLLGPDGGEQAYNDDQRGVNLYGAYDAQIADWVLRETGTYTIVVEWVRGSGTYTLGVSANRTFILNPQSAARLEGALQDVFPVQRWIFEGTAGQVVTFTMFAESGDLDPALELIQPGGSRLAYNDDAYNPDLGVNAQLFRVTLPDDGIYVLEASRYDGSGRYSIVGLVNNS